MMSTPPTAPTSVDGYDYELPAELIAHQPAAQRAASQLMICAPGQPRRVAPFSHIVDEVQPGDLVVFNDTRVVPCRLHGRKPTGGRVEVFVLSPLDAGWDHALSGEGVLVHALVRSNKPPKPGLVLELEGVQGVTATLEGRQEASWRVRLRGQGQLLEVMQEAGKTPLPPYITSRRRALGQDEVQDGDKERYQTVYAAKPGAVAAPTAGLHFTPEVLEALKARGVELGFVTLHVGIGTFKPLGDDGLQRDELHREVYLISQELQRQVEAVQARGGRLIAVGTTSARALEDQARRWQAPRVQAGAWETRLFIKPGYTWRLVQGLVTNFHLPRSSLLVLVAALMGYEPMRQAYQGALRRKLRFYSYGDAMLLWRSPANREA
jgi:S-adenosylmethionine:tRNA ribosyltransferase-isomerase